MKFILIKTIFLISVLSFSFSQSKSEKEADCDNPCQSCQRTVYQLKFQKMADCGTIRCKNTCFTIKESWNNVNNIYEPFLKDIFGKCEICFRAGFCKISECKEQEETELKIIEKVVNASKLSAKTDDIEKQIGSNNLKGDNIVLDKNKLSSLNTNIDAANTRLQSELNAGVASKNINPVLDDIKETFDDMFKEPFKSAGVENAGHPRKSFEIVMEAYKIFAAHVRQVLDFKKEVHKFNSKPEDVERYKKLAEITLKEVTNKKKEFRRMISLLKKQAHPNTTYANSLLDCEIELEDFSRSLVVAKKI